MTSSAKLTLRPLPHLEFIAGFPGIPASSQRAAAHIAGTIEVRLRGGLKASFLRIELRKLESVPGGETWGELVGRGPTAVWSARPGKGAGDREEDADGCWELLTTADFPFRIAIPEGLPPSARLDKQCGVSYELVTSLCVRGKKGLLRSAPTSSIVQTTHPINIEKHELHSTWPIYNVPDEHEAENDGIICRVERSQTCYGPGDTVTIRVVVRSRRVTPVKLKSVAFSIRETVTFRGGAGGAKTSRLSLSGSSGAAASQRTETIAQKAKSASKKLYKDEEQEFVLSCQIARSHALPTITTAKHIEVAYTMRVFVDISKAPIVVDHLPLTMSAFSSLTSSETTPKIGFVPGLSDVEVDQSTTTSGGRRPERSMTADSSYYGGGMSRSQSFSSSAAGRVFGVGGNVRRRDTVMTQATTTSGPGMAGRGVPGQMFGWAQPYPHQPYAPPHAAFAGQDGQQLLAPEEDRALFHHTNRPDSAAMFGVDQRDTLNAPGVYAHTNSAPSSSVRLATPQDNSTPPSSVARLGTPQDDPTRDHFAPTHSPTPNPHASSVSQQQQHHHHHHQHSPSAALAAQQAQLARFANNNNNSAAAAAAPRAQSSAADTLTSAHRAAEEEKMRLYERARQQAERNQRRADEIRAQQAVLGSVAARNLANGGSASQHGRSTSAAISGGGSAPAVRVTSAPVPAPYVSAEAEKARLYERARKEAESYQSGYAQGASFPPETSVSTVLATASPAPALASAPAKAAAPPAIVTGAAAAAPATASRPQNTMIDRAYLAALSPADREAEERRRSSAKYWLDSPHVDIPATAVEAPPHGGVIGGSGATNTPNVSAPSASSAAVPGGATSTASSTLRAYPTAEEEKRRLYETAKAEQEAAERDANARSSAAPPSLGAIVTTPALDLPGSWPANTPQPTPQPTPQLQLHSPPPPQHVPGSMPINARDEKAQLAAYHAAQDAVARQQSAPLSSSATSPSFNNSFAPAYQAQSRLLTTLPAGLSEVSPMTTPLPSDNKVAYSFAPPTQSTLISSSVPQAGGSASGLSRLPAVPTSAVSEKEQLRLYYAARDAQGESERVAAELATSSASAATSPALTRPAPSYAANYARPGDAPASSPMPASGSVPTFSGAAQAGGYTAPASAPSSAFLPSQAHPRPHPPAPVPVQNSGHAYSGSSASAYALAAPTSPDLPHHDASIARGKQRSLSPALPSTPPSLSQTTLSFGEASTVASASTPAAGPTVTRVNGGGAHAAQRMPSIYAPVYAKANWDEEEPQGVASGAAPPPLPPKLPPKTPIL